MARSLLDSRAAALPRSFPTTQGPLLGGFLCKYRYTPLVLCKAFLFWIKTHLDSLLLSLWQITHVLPVQDLNMDWIIENKKVEQNVYGASDLYLLLFYFCCWPKNARNADFLWLRRRITSRKSHGYFSDREKTSPWIAVAIYIHKAVHTSLLFLHFSPSKNTSQWAKKILWKHSIFQHILTSEKSESKTYVMIHFFSNF